MTMPNKREQAKPDWWDGRNEGSFFRSVYREGDESKEGHLENQLLSLDQRTMRECDMVERLLSLQPGQNILDCPCGYGRHTLELAKRGYCVDGVDLCDAFLDEARSQIVNMDINGEARFHNGDMRDLPVDGGGFDACINMFLSFGFFSDAENIKVLKQFRRVLKPGGRLLIHTDVNPDRAIAGIYSDRYERNLTTPGKLIIDEHYDPQTALLEGVWKIERDDKSITSPTYAIRIYTHTELVERLCMAGFEHVSIYDGEGREIDDTNAPQEVVYVAE